MKCPKCREHVEKTKHIARVVVRPAGKVDDRFGMVYMPVGKDRIGKEYLVLLVEL
jgi:hypothetical protein